MPSRDLDVRIDELRRQPGRTWGLLDAVVAVLAVPVGLAVLVGLVEAGLRLSDGAVPVVASAALGGLAFLAGRRAAAQSGGWSAALGLDLPEWPDAWRVVRWTALLLVLQFALVAVLFSLPALRDVEPETNTDLLVDQSLPMLVLLVVLVVTVTPVVEELLFRGVALRGLMLRWGFWPAAVLSTSFFAMLHVQELTAGSVQVVAATGVLGLGLCVLTRRTGRLGPAIGVHSLHNAVVFLVTVATT